ncbi:MAG: DNA mismatch endonuclease Vsr [Methanosarcinaceae archaeon]|nr:DNA mismatch endonuclease Vsr [Methanosarcinaceae archaeon]
MSQVKGKNTKPEIIVRQILYHHGYRYRLYAGDLPGKPDIVFRRLKKVIFIHGCFWHRHDCPKFVWPKSNADFWREKIEKNVRRDRENYRKLTESGWKFLILWECEIKNMSEEELLQELERFLKDI